MGVLGKERALRVDTALNVILLAVEAWALVRRFLELQFGMFQFYTQCSNALAAVAALLCIVANLRGAGAERAHGLKHWACCTQLMTFVVVLLVLMPAVYAIGGDGFREMFIVAHRPITHFLGPLLTFVSYVFYEADPLPTKRDSLVALLPTLLYAIVAYTCNILRVFEGPYPFFYVWRMPVWQSVLWFLVLLVVAWLLAQLPRLAAARVTPEPKASR